MADMSETLRHDLREPEFSEGYAESFLATSVATQIKVLREQREMTQAQLAERLGTKQTVISRIENINYSAWNISTLKRLARVFNVRLRISFETYGSLIDEMKRFSRKSLERVPRDEDPILCGWEAATPEVQTVSVVGTGGLSIGGQATTYVLYAEAGAFVSVPLSAIGAIATVQTLSVGPTSPPASTGARAANSQLALAA